MKQRLVGTLVLGCLALIFIPLLLDGEGISTPGMTVNVPPRPEFSTSPIAEPQRPQIKSDQQTADTIEDEPVSGAAEDDSAEVTIPLPVPPELAAQEDASETGLQPQLDAQGLPEAWSVRLGSFGERANAQSLLQRLIDADYKAYSRPVGALTGVFVGPLLSRGEAQQIRDELQREFDLNGIVVRFSVEDP